VNDRLEKDLEGNVRDLIVRCLFRTCLEGLRKSTKNFSVDSRCPGRYFNRQPPECEAGVLTVLSASFPRAFGSCEPPYNLYGSRDLPLSQLFRTEGPRP
jgi:hypothetical protein